MSINKIKNQLHKLFVRVTNTTSSIPLEIKPAPIPYNWLQEKSNLMVTKEVVPIKPRKSKKTVDQSPTESNPVVQQDKSDKRFGWIWVVVTLRLFFKTNITTNGEKYVYYQRFN